MRHHEEESFVIKINKKDSVIVGIFLFSLYLGFLIGGIVVNHGIYEGMKSRLSISNR